jgi:membrane protease YdiL (CAAX protease family)
MDPVAARPEPSPSSARGHGLLAPSLIGAGVTALAGVLSYLVPSRHAATSVGFCFFIATYALVMRRSSETIRHHGVSLGGLFEPVPLSLRRIAADTRSAVSWALGASLLLLPLFWLGFIVWWHPRQDFDPSRWPSLDEVIGQVLVIALPEELFYRGYLQTALEDAAPPRRRVLGAEVGLGLVLSSAIFAAGHLLTEPHPARLAVFFPSLVFGWLFARTRGVGAAILFHAACNLFSAYLARGYGFMH